MKAFLGALVAVTVLGCGGAKSKAAAESAALDFHQRLDRGDFAGIYAATDPEFKKASPEADFTAILAAVHRKLGAVRSAEEVGWRINSFNLKTNVVLNYKTAFSDGDATEVFTYRSEGASARLLGYNINSTALITK